jgi:hypothetical protein
MNELAAYGKNKDISDIYRWLNEFKRYDHSRSDLVKYESGKVFADSHNIWNRWKKNFCQLLNIHRFNDVRQIEMHTDEQLVTDPSVKMKHKPAVMNGRTTQRTLSSNRHLFKLGLTNSPIWERWLEEDESATHVVCEYEAVGYLRFRHICHYFMEPSDYNDGTISKVMNLIPSIGLIKEWVKRRNTIDLEGRSERFG